MPERDPVRAPSEHHPRRPGAARMRASFFTTILLQILALLRQRGMVRLAEFRATGVAATTVSRLERAGAVIRLGRGLYQHLDATVDAHHVLAEAYKRIPNGVICLVSALAFHDLTDQMPPRV